MEPTPDEKPAPAASDKYAARVIPVFAAAVTALLIAVIYAAPLDEGPDEVVYDYLAAAQDGDVDRAFAALGKRPYRKESGRFLKAGTTTGDWSIESTTVTTLTDTYDYDGGYDDRERIKEATVGFTVDVPGRRDVTGSFDLTRREDDSRWTFTNPLANVQFASTPLWYVEANGVRAPYKTVEIDDERQPETYVLLPGMYRFYSDVGETVKVDNTATPVFPGQDAWGSRSDDELVAAELPSPKMKLTGDGEKAVAAEVRDLIDQCAQATEMETEGCPFGADPITGPDSLEGRLDDFADITWTITEYPKVAAVLGDGSVEIADRQRGVATVKFTGYESISTGEGLARGDSDRASAACEIRTGDLEAGFNADGSVTVIPEGFRFEEFPGEHYYPGNGDTCQ